MEPLHSAHNVGSGCCHTTSEQKQINGGGEVDTSAPFESVKEAVTRFGGLGFWKPHSKHLLQNDNEEEFDAEKAELQAAQLATDLMVKERETLEVLKELEATKTLVEELKVKLQKESAAVNEELKEVKESREENDENTPESESTPGSILMELKQAKLNLTRTTNDLADIRATVETYSKMIEKERFELEKTRQRLSSNCSKVSSFDETVDSFPRELHRLTSETERFKKVGEAAKSEVLRSMNSIKQTKKRIKTAEIRLIAARKLKEAARASEALARFEIKAISESQTLSEGEGVTLSFDEYNYLKSKAQEADESLIRKVNEPVMKSISESQTLSEGGDLTLSFNKYNCLKSKAQEADESLVKKVNESVKANEPELYKAEILNRVEEATEEVKHSKRVLEEALSKAEAANNEKLKAQEAFSKWRSDHGRRRKSMVQNLTKFKNSSSRSNNGVLDVNRANLGVSVSGPILAGPILAPTMSIGQILNRKLLLTEEYYEKSDMRRKVSLAQMLSKPTSVGGGGVGGGDSIGGKGKRKRKKFGFGRIQFLVTKPNKKKKKHIGSPRLSSTIG
ncbi:WEB family protein At2g38370-like [Bidens hawaiensis]|uniref:WEB family protein At2g38370-like n=1 Tax=Bidens hawaiensis TaxID=980011 RepID=UPI00404952EF